MRFVPSETYLLLSSYRVGGFLLVERLTQLWRAHRLGGGAVAEIPRESGDAIATGVNYTVS